MTKLKVSLPKKNSHNSIPGIILFILWGLYAGFTVYGSLIPFEYHFIPVEEAVRRFTRIPFLHLGMYSREDWIANGILYFPLGYLTLVLFDRNKSFFITKVICSILICIWIAVSTEFLQLYFPNRTVSQNDLIAEILGSFSGVFLFLIFGNFMKKQLLNIINRRSSALRSMILIYCLGYFFYVFFPFNFILSAKELASKFHGAYFAWFFIVDTKRPLFIIFLKIAAEIFTIIPLGIAWGLFFNLSFSRIRIIGAGILIAFLIEGIQLFLISGITQGVSVLLKTAGFYLGYLVYEKWDVFIVEKTAALLQNKKMIAITWVGYLTILVFANWSGRGDLKIVSNLARTMDNISLLPFYYHYKMPESQALFSMVAYFILYFPVGLFFSIDTLHKKTTRTMRLFFFSFFTGLVLSGIFECGKMFFSNGHPDITNLLIGAAGSISASVFILWLKTMMPERTGSI